MSRQSNAASGCGQGLSESLLPIYCFFRRAGRDEFLESGVIPQRIEHWIKAEQRRSERHALNQGATVRDREQLL
jgi:hypothetical protein